MRLSLLAFVAFAALASGCTLDREGLGEYSASSSGGSSQAGTGGAGGTQPGDSSAGSGGASDGGSGGSSGSAGTGASGGSSGSGGLDGGEDAPAEVGPDKLPIENCFNGQDDDNDGKVDCDDTDCTSVVVCVPSVPTGWSGPEFVWTRGAEESAADCGDFEPLGTFHSTFDEGTHTCACGCNSPSGGACSGGSLKLFSGDDCVTLITDLAGDGCHPVSGGATSVASFSAVGSPATPTSQGTCTAFPAETVVAAAWTDAADLCAAKQTFGGCAAGLVCVPRAPVGLPAEACVSRSGLLACPAQYPVNKTWYGSLTDTRACTAAGCTCAGATGGSCTGKMRFHSDDSCGATTAVGVFDLDGTCKNTHQGPAQIKSVDFQAAGPSGGKCQAAGTGTLTGSVAPSDPNTICCQTPTN